MRRFVLLAIAFVLGLYGVYLAQQVGDLPTQFRDGAFLLILAAALAAWNAAPYPTEWNRTTWSSIARALVGGGIVTALLALVLRAFPLAALPHLAEIVWGVGIAAAFAGILLPPVVTRFAPPAFTWAKGSDGTPIRKATNADEANSLAATRGRFWNIALITLLLAGAALRIWAVTDLPPVCRAAGGIDECGALLYLAPDSSDALPFVSAAVIPLARALSLLGGVVAPLADPLWALRWAAALSSLLMLPLFLLALRPHTSKAGSLLGVALFALSPLFIATATGDPLAAEQSLWLLLAVLGGATSLRSENPRGWAMLALALGLLALTLPAWIAAWTIWLLVAVFIIAIFRLDQWKTAIAVLLGGALAGAAMSSASWEMLTAPFDLATPTDWFSAAGDWLPTAPAGAGWILALAAVGVGGAFRLRRVGALLLVGAAATIWAALRVDAAHAAPLILLLALLAAIAVDQLLRAAQRALKPMILPRAMLALALIALVFLCAANLITTSRGDSLEVSSTDDAAAQVAIGFMRDSRSDPALAQSMWLLAPSLYRHPAFRSSVDTEMAQGRVQPFAAVADLPYTGDTSGGLTYILPASDPLTLETLRAVYPEGRTLPLASADGADLVTIFRVDPALLFDSTGLAQFVYEGSEWGSADEAALSLGVGPLHFEWATTPPRAAPFSVEWDGSLLVPTAGLYAFTVAAPQGSTFSMTLDDRLILDSSLGLTQRTETLPEGALRLRMRYRSGDAPGDLTIAWQPPAQEMTPIPRESLYNPAVPAMGLLGTYTAGSAWDGVVLSQRKDLQIVPDGTLELPWGVVWQGYLAAPRTGEYLIGAVTNGALMLDVDGVRPLTHIPNPADLVAPPVEGSIYLDQGWAPVTIRFAPDATRPNTLPELRLYWQTPGNNPEPLRATYFTPAAGDAEVTRPLPELAPANTQLGNDSFALTADNQLWQVGTIVPPRALPALLMENTGAWGSCGAGDTQFNAAHGIAWDATSGKIYIADTGNQRVAIVDPATGLIDTLPIEGLEEPVDVALTPTGSLLVLDTAAPRLVRVTLASGASQVIPLTDGFYRPRALAVDQSGVIYIADTGGARVAAITADGGVITSIGGPETRLGRGQPAAVGVTPNTLWALAAEAGRLWNLNVMGSLNAIQPVDTINGPHITPVGDAFFLSDPARQQIIWFAPSGEPRGFLGDTGAFDQPTGIAALQQGDQTLLAVMDTARCSLTTWRADTQNLP